MLFALILLFLLIIISFLFYGINTINTPLAKQGNNELSLKVNKDVAYLFCIFSVFFVLLAFRDVSVGNDTQNYADLYDTIVNGYLKEDTRYEVGYILYNKVLGVFSSSYRLLLIVSAFIVVCSFASIIRKFSNKIWLSVLLLFLLSYFDISANLLRQAIAMAILLCAFDILLKKRSALFVIYVLFASTFHLMSLVFVVAIIVPYVNLTKTSLLILLLVLMGAYFLSDYLVNYIFNNIALYSSYENSEYVLGGIKIASILNSLIFALVLIFSLFKYQDLKDDLVTRSAFWMVAIGEILLLLSLGFNQIGRVSKMFTIFAIILIPNVLSIIKRKSGKLYIILCILWIIFLTIQYLLIVKYRSNWHGIYPYKLSF